MKEVWTEIRVAKRGTTPPPLPPPPLIKVGVINSKFCVGYISLNLALAIIQGWIMWLIDVHYKVWHEQVYRHTWMLSNYQVLTISDRWSDELEHRLPSTQLWFEAHW